MTDLKLFQLNDNKVSELQATSFEKEKTLQNLVENNLDDLFAINFLATEYSTGKKHNGRIDSLGLDENNCPCIVEYKRTKDNNVILQGLYYLDWLMDHKADFERLVSEKISLSRSKEIEWSSPRLICIANKFSKFDEHAIKQIDRDVELIRYKKYNNDMLIFELVDRQTAFSGTGWAVSKNQKAKCENKILTEKGKSKNETFAEKATRAGGELRNTFDNIENYILSLGDDIITKELNLYKAYKRIKNFVCLVVKPQSKYISIHLRLDPSKVNFVDGLMRNIENMGYGTGRLELRISSNEDFEKVKYLIDQAYEKG
jgi:predicted transport protein